MYALCTYAGGGEQEAGVLVVDEHKPRAVEVGENLPDADRVAVAAHRLPVLHQHTHHVACLGKRTEVRMANGEFPSAGWVGPHVGAVVEEVSGDGVAEDAAFPVVVGEEFHLLPLLLVPAFDLQQQRNLVRSAQRRVT